MTTKIYDRLPFYVKFLDETDGDGYLKEFCSYLQSYIELYLQRYYFIHLIYNPETCPQEWVDWYQQWVGGHSSKENWMGVGVNPAWPAEKKRDFLKKAWGLWNAKGTEWAIRESYSMWLDVPELKEKKNLKFYNPFGRYSGEPPERWWTYDTPYNFPQKRYEEKKVLACDYAHKVYTPEGKEIFTEWKWDYREIWNDGWLKCKKSERRQTYYSNLTGGNVWLFFKILDLKNWNKISPGAQELNPHIFYASAIPSVYLEYEFSPDAEGEALNEKSFNVKLKEHLDVLKKEITKISYNLDGFKYDDIFPFFAGETSTEIVSSYQVLFQTKLSAQYDLPLAGEFLFWTNEGIGTISENGTNFIDELKELKINLSKWLLDKIEFLREYEVVSATETEILFPENQYNDIYYSNIETKTSVKKREITLFYDLSPFWEKEVEELVIETKSNEEYHHFSVGSEYSNVFYSDSVFDIQKKAKLFLEVEDNLLIPQKKLLENSFGVLEPVLNFCATYIDVFYAKEFVSFKETQETILKVNEISAFSNYQDRFYESGTTTSTEKNVEYYLSVPQTYNTCYGNTWLSFQAIETESTTIKEFLISAEKWSSAYVVINTQTKTVIEKTTVQSNAHTYFYYPKKEVKTKDGVEIKTKDGVEVKIEAISEKWAVVPGTKFKREITTERNTIRQDNFFSCFDYGTLWGTTGRQEKYVDITETITLGGYFGIQYNDVYFSKTTEEVVSKTKEISSEASWKINTHSYQDVWGFFAINWQEHKEFLGFCIPSDVWTRDEVKNTTTTKILDSSFDIPSKEFYQDLVSRKVEKDFIVEEGYFNPGEIWGFSVTERSEEKTIYSTTEKLLISESFLYGDIYYRHLPKEERQDIVSEKDVYMGGNFYNEIYKNSYVWSYSVKEFVFNTVTLPEKIFIGKSWISNKEFFIEKEEITEEELEEEKEKNVNRFITPGFLWNVLPQIVEETNKEVILTEQQCTPGFKTIVSLEPTTESFIEGRHLPYLSLEIKDDYLIETIIPGKDGLTGFQYTQKWPIEVKNISNLDSFFDGYDIENIKAAFSSEFLTCQVEAELDYDSYRIHGNRYVSPDIFWQKQKEIDSISVEYFPKKYFVKSPNRVSSYLSIWGYQYPWYYKGEEGVLKSQTTSTEKEISLCNVADNYSMLKFYDYKEETLTLVQDDINISEILPDLENFTKCKNWSLIIETSESIVIKAPTSFYSYDENDKQLFELKIANKKFTPLFMEFVFCLERKEKIKSLTLNVKDFGIIKRQDFTEYGDLNCSSKDKIKISATINLVAEATTAIYA